MRVLAIVGVTAPLLFLADGLPAVAGVQEAKRVARGWIDANQESLNRVNKAIWTHAEIGLQETRSAQELIALLEANGFAVQKGVAGMPTAFVASWGRGAPVIGILAEYDALPGLSQDAVPERKTRAGADAGHGCGHSIFGTASTAAAIAVKHALEAARLAGTIRLYGTPAEETLIGKVYMLREGLFGDADAVLTWHADERTGADFSYSKAMVSAKFRFKGLPAHASVSPHEGRSALDAVELMNTGANFLREHVREDARIHYVITKGGGQPNVVPAETEVWYYVRADRHGDVERYFERVHEIARGAALMTRTELQPVQVDTDVHEVLPNRTLAELVQRNLTEVGPPRFSDDEKAFARKTQEPLGRAFDKPLADGIEPLPAAPGQEPGSTDVGAISWHLPVGSLVVASYTWGAPSHSWQIVACTGMSIGEKGMLVAAKTLAGTAIDLALSPELLVKAKEDLRKVRGAQEYKTLLPEGQRAPAAIR
jgi:aminobenzoyl-glutamate utilization protein B